MPGPRIKLRDGRVVQFPDGATQKDVDAFLEDLYGKREGFMARAGKSFVRELAGLPETAAGYFEYAAPKPDVRLADQLRAMGRAIRESQPVAPPETTREKVADIAGGVLPQVAAILPQVAAGTALTGSPVAGGALGMAAASAARTDPLQPPEAGELVKDVGISAIEGALFGTLGKIAPREMAWAPRKLIHGTGATGIGYAGGVARGVEDPELHAAAMGVMGVIGAGGRRRFPIQEKKLALVKQRDKIRKAEPLDPREASAEMIEATNKSPMDTKAYEQVDKVLLRGGLDDHYYNLSNQAYARQRGLNNPINDYIIAKSLLIKSLEGGPVARQNAQQALDLASKTAKEVGMRENSGPVVSKFKSVIDDLKTVLAESDATKVRAEQIKQLGKPPQEKLNLQKLEQAQEGWGRFTKGTEEYKALEKTVKTIPEMTGDGIRIAKEMLEKNQWTVDDVPWAKMPSAERAQLLLFAEATGRHQKAIAQAKEYAQAGDKAMAGQLLEASRENLRSTLHGIAEVRGEAARTLRIAQEPMDRVGEILYRLSKKGRLEDSMIDKLTAPDASAQTIADAVRVLRKPSVWDMWYDIYVNGLLSGPMTQVVNVTSNQFMQVLDAVEVGLAIPGEKAVTSLQNAYRGLKGEGKIESARSWHEFRGEGVGWWEGLKKGVHEVKKALRDETYYGDDMLIRLEHAQQALPGKTGKFIRMPGRVLVAGDLFYKTMGGQREGWKIAYRDAAKQGFKGKDLVMAAQRRMGNIVNDKALLDAMIAKGRELTFTKELGQFGRAATSIRDVEIPGTGVKPLAIPFPFVRTPLNIMMESLKRTPLGAIRFAKGTNLDRAALSQEIAKTTLGSVLFTIAWAKAEEGGITGAGPEDLTERYNLMGTKEWQPYSIRVNDDTLVSFARIEPFASVLGLAVDFKNAFDKYMAGDVDQENIINEITSDAMHIIKENLTNKTFLQGAQQLMRAVDRPEAYMKIYAKNLFGTLLPFSSLLGQITRATDPTVRQADFEMMTVDLPFFGEIKIPEIHAALIPGLSQHLPERTTPLGKPVVRPEHAGMPFAPPAVQTLTSPGMRVMKAEPDTTVVEKEFDRLSAYPSIPPGMPPRTKTMQIDTPFGERVRLTDDEYAVYEEFHKKANAALHRAITSPNYQNMHDDSRAMLLQSIYRAYRKAANQKVNALVVRRVIQERDIGK